MDPVVRRRNDGDWWALGWEEGPWKAFEADVVEWLKVLRKTHTIDLMGVDLVEVGAKDGLITESMLQIGVEAEVTVTAPANLNSKGTRKLQLQLRRIRRLKSILVNLECYGQTPSIWNIEDSEKAGKVTSAWM